MNSNTILELLQTGFRISVGATTSLVETLQDPQKRTESLSVLLSQFSQQVAHWAAKGEITEQEARNFIEAIFRQQNYPGSPATPAPAETVRTPTRVASPSVLLELEELTTQTAAIRTELEKQRNLRSNG
jgi:polyhydroxyalkanoate synthesis regulator phasin